MVVKSNRMDKLSRALKGGTRITVSMPFLSYEFSPADLVNSESIDARIARLGEIKSDLEAASSAVQSLQDEAYARKAEADKLKAQIAELEEDKNAAESILKVPEDTFARLLGRATAKGRVRGIIEGVLIGLTTGATSSALIWYLTR